MTKIAKFVKLARKIGEMFIGVVLLFVLIIGPPVAALWAAITNPQLTAIVLSGFFALFWAAIWMSLAICCGGDEDEGGETDG